MQKAILISIQPQHVLNIITGEKTLELRKSVPKNFEGWVYIYCTKVKPLLGYGYVDEEGYYYELGDRIDHLDTLKYNLNGLVIARFWFDNFITLQKDESYHEFGDFFGTDVKGNFYFGEDILSQSCEEFIELKSYWKNGKLFAWNINSLEVFDNAKTLVNYIIPHISRTIDNCKTILYLPVQKAPQSWMYVWVNE